MVFTRTFTWANIFRGAILFFVIFGVYLTFSPARQGSCPQRMQFDPNSFLSPSHVTSHQLDFPSNLVQLSKAYSNLPIVKDLRDHFKELTYLQILAEIASPDKVVVVALIDGAFIDMAINFYITCIAAHDIRNYLLLATDYPTCDKLLQAGIHCHVYRLDKAAKEASIYHSTSFLRKMNLRTGMILDALTHGFKVLHTDIDMFYIQNPLLYLEQECGAGCDIIALKDGESFNAGFVYVKPTVSGIGVYAEMQEMVNNNSTKDDQQQLNDALASQQAKNKQFTPRFFPEDLYLCGKFYYEDSKRHFALDAVMSPCPKCVVIHNNWIVSMEAKVYRARELHQWMFDGDKYYSSLDRKYLVYGNPLVGAESVEEEQHALRNALAFGGILNRTVILPKFHCACSLCAANSIIMINSLDKYFPGKYREHSFLLHPIVPSNIKQSFHKPVFIETNYVKQKLTEQEIQRINKEYVRSNISHSLTEKEIQQEFGDVKDSILYFVHMYGTFSHFNDASKQSEFDERITLGVISGNYRQYVNK